MINLRHIISEYKKWRNRWDDLCKRCGQCCYTRSLSKKREVIVDYNSPCEFLDEKTLLCRVFENRFYECSYCQRVNLFRSLFNPLLPKDCSYVETFRK